MLRFGAFREEVRHHLLLGRGDGVVALLLAHDRIGGAQVLLGEAEHLLLERLVVGDDEVARLLGGVFGELDDRLDHRLEMPVAEHHGAEHDLFGQLLCFGLHHHHRVLRAGDDEVELALLHLVEGRIEHVFVVDEADAGAADRAHERRAGERQRGGGRDHRHDVGIVLQVVRQHGDDHLRVAAPALGEQRTDRAVDQARGQRFLFGRTALALEIAAGNLAGGVIFLVVVDGQREEVDAVLGLLGGDDGGEHGGLAVGGQHGAVGLTRDFAGFQRELAAAPVKLYTLDIEHCDCLSWFSRRCESHEQDGETLSAQQWPLPSLPASGDPAMALGPSCECDGPAARRSKSAASAAGQMGGRIMRSATKRAGLPARKLFNGGYPAVQSAPCNALRWCAAGSRESGAAATRASAARAASGCLSCGS